ncbi:MAG: efflux RND transporter permease subunit, partial [Clostridia bacterium]|nr:efflux RND transporter permease subunit [Clostridia bacterium]
MKKFFSFIIKQSVAIVLVVVFVLGFGIYSTLNMSVNLLPDINVPMVCVQVIYPGANAKSVEKDVTEKLEEGLSSISGITDVSSYSYDNLSAVVLSFDYGTDPSDKKRDISGKLSGMSLPDGITTSVYDIDLNAEALAVFSVTSDKGETSSEKLAAAHAAAKELETSISAIDGVERVEIKGGAENTYVVTPFIGLELLSPLFVQAFSYGVLDLPLGNITENGADVQIRNNSDITTVEDIRNMPVEIPSSLVTLLSSVKQVMGYYEDSTEADLIQLRDDIGEGVIVVLGEIDTMSAEQIEDLSTLKTYMNIAGNYTAEQLQSFRRSRYYNEIYKQVTIENEDGTRTPKSEEELEELLDDIKDSNPALAQYVTLDMLKVVSEGKLDLVIEYRTEYLEVKPDYNPDEFYTLSDEDYYVLETQYVKVYGIENPDEAQQAELLNRIEFAKKTSAAGLAAIADKKKDEGQNYVPTDGECALLFLNTELSEEHPIITSSTFIAFVRSEHYEKNMNELITRREGLGEEITAAGWYSLYSALNLEGVFEFKLGEQLFGFILDTDLGDLTPNGGKAVKINDIANVVEEDNFTSYVYFGKSGASVVKGTIIEVYKSNGANASAVVNAAKAVCQEYGGDVNIALLDDQSEFISDSISNVLVSMLIGGALAVIIIFLFLKKVRTSAIIAVTMPLSVLAALICLYIMGITLNMVSLGGLAVGIGMLVDNSIVVIESISKHRDMDKTAFEAAVDGTVEVAGALFGSTLTTVCVFIPIIFSGGLTGEIFTDLSWAVIFSLAFSLIVAVTVIPALYALLCGDKRMLKGGRLKKEEVKEEETKAEKKPVKQKLAVLKEPKIMNGITSVYSRILPAVLNKKLITILSAVLIFGASIGLLFLTGTEFLPSIDKGLIEINMTYGATSDLQEVESDVFRFAEKLESELDDIDFISVSVGKNGLLALTDTGIIKVQLTTNRGTQKVVEKIRDTAENTDWLKGTVSVREIDGVVASLMSGADDLSVTIVGEDGDVLKRIADDIGKKLEEGGFRDVKNSATDVATEYDLKFDRMKMTELGLDYQTLVLTLRIGIASYTACSVTIDGNEYNLNVRFGDGAVTSLDTLENFVVGADDGKAVKLKDICEITKNLYLIHISA